MRCANIRIHADIPVVEEAGYLRFHDHNNVVYSIEAIQKACEKASNLPIIKYDERGVEQVVGVAQSIKWNPNGFIEIDGMMLFGGTTEFVKLGNDNCVVSMEFSAVGLG